MPRLKNPRREAFAQAIARGFSYIEAQEVVGYAVDTGTASKLANRPEVQARVAELMARAAGAVTVTKAWVLEKLVENALGAMAEKARGPANRALELIGKEIGMFVDRAEVGRPGDFDRMDDEELYRAYLAAIAAERLGLPAPTAGDATADGREGESG